MSFAKLNKDVCIPILGSERTRMDGFSLNTNRIEEKIIDSIRLTNNTAHSAISVSL